MKIITRLSVLVSISLFSFLANAGSWDFHQSFSNLKGKDVAHIGYYGGDCKDISKAFERISVIKPSHIAIGRVINIEDESIQKQLEFYFEKHHSDLYEKALSSSGNMHNPKVRPLRGLFKRAFTDTNCYKTIEAEVAVNGYLITDVSYEKFQLIGEEKKFDAWVVIGIKPKD